MQLRWLALLVLTSLAACATLARHEQRYGGTLSPCGGTATLTRLGDRVAFAPDDGVVVLRGALAPDGSFAASLNPQPAGKPAFLMSVSGHLDAERASMAYATPRCRTNAVLIAK